MLFNSIEFLLFLPIVFLFYWFVFDWFLSKSKHQLLLQNAFVVVVSYVFYGWWDWRFLILIAITSLCSWGSGVLMLKVGQTTDSPKQTKQRKIITTINIVLNLAILATFKYYDFFVTEFAKLFNFSADGLLLKVILPVGISFYTFQALSYSIDVYRHKIEPTKDIFAFFAFLSFFPQLVAGPIERATNLLPQFLKKREFDYGKAVDGCRQILWGLFKKVVVADNCAIVVNQIFDTYQDQSGGALLLGALFFAFQIYGDFSGYSDIAIGTARLFGIRLMQNFKTPYFSRDIAEFWRRWHISLTTWFRDYVYIPLGGSRCSRLKIVRNTFVIFLVSGFWHGANWTFIVWGVYHAFLFLPLILLGKNRKNTNIVAEGRVLPSLKEFLQILLTFGIVVIGWVIFRVKNISDVVVIFSKIFSFSVFSAFELDRKMYMRIVILLVFILIEWFTREKKHPLESLERFCRFKIFRWGLYVSVVIFIFFSMGTPQPFVYFQF
ncbi:MAG: MBOAT family protein [Bacteroidales bacterium]|nr:MBOAT family protein [Bacteroidales bacterium]